MEVSSSKNNIVLTTFNAKYIHTSIGLRYLLANLKDLKETSCILEFGINDNISQTAEKILNKSPRIVGIGVYIWNALQVSELISVIKKVSPKTKVILGGPEVSHLPLRIDFSQADYIIQGEGEVTFYKLCKALINNSPISEEKVIKSETPEIEEIELPYRYYTDKDIKDRIIYVEASRGCPFRCEFCLSSIDKKVRYFDLGKLLQEIELLWQKGARSFKFIDRTFNLRSESTNQILDYFLKKEPEYFIHFEVVPDQLEESTKERLKQFPEAAIQLEVGIQTLNSKTAENISRKLNFGKIKENLVFFQMSTKVYLHVDLIIGLPGESIESFAENLNQLTKLTNSEIQLGILKKLSGTAISRHDERFGMVYSDTPPYEILQNDLISFQMMQKMKRFARFWDLVYNSGNFQNTIRLILDGDDVFNSFFSFSEWIYSQTESTWQISQLRMAELIFNYLVVIRKKDKAEAADSLIVDMLRTNNRNVPRFLKDSSSGISHEQKKSELSKTNKRQKKHL